MHQHIADLRFQARASCTMRRAWDQYRPTGGNNDLTSIHGAGLTLQFMATILAVK
jgi:hypothetical protein